jgi:hypothetical protein
MAKSRESALERWQAQKDKGKPVAEHILSIVKAGLSAAPFAGAIASLMSDYIPESRSARLEEFAEQIADDLLRLEDRISAEYLLTDDYAFMFEQCFKGVAEYPQREKLEAFRGILVNSAIPGDLSEEEKEFFLNLVANLSVLDIRIIKFMAFPEEYLSEAGIPREQIQGGFSTFFPRAIPGINLDVIKAAFADLNRYGFTNTDKSAFGTFTAGQGLELLRGRVTDLGMKFIAFCSVPS